MKLLQRYRSPLFVGFAWVLCGFLGTVPPVAAQVAKGTSSISGIVVEDVTGTPINGATIVRPSGKPVITDVAGRFMLENVEEGSVTLNFSANQYLSRELRYTIDAGEALKDQVVRLKSPGVIHGRVFNANGTVAVGVTVGLLRFIEGKTTGPFLEGEDLPELYSNSTVKTNDRGEFRIFGLAPGRYQISFAANEGPAEGSASSGFPSFIYPRADRIAAGEVIELIGGDDVSLKDVTPAGIRYDAVRLHVVNSAGVKDVELSFRFTQFFTTPDGLRVMGMMARLGLSETLHLQEGGEVLRTYWPNEPGTYAIKATWKNADGSTETISKNVAFSGAGMDVELPLKAAAPGVGQLTVWAVREVAGGGVESVSGVNVAINSAASGPPPKSGTRTGDDGKYRLEGIPTGRYAIYNLSGLTEDLYFTGVKQGENDALKEGFVVSEGDTILKAFAEGGAGVLRGNVTNNSMNAVQDVYVVMLPDSPSPAQNLSSALAHRTDQKGDFEIKRIPPGSYRVYAWLHSGTRSYLNPKFLEPFVGKATAIEIRKGEGVTANLKILDEKAP